MRLSWHILTRLHQWTLDLHRCSNPEEFQPLVPEALASLIPCDRASFKQIEVSPDGNSITLHPCPPWWPQYREVYQRHLLDHPLWGAGSTDVIDFSRHENAKTWLTTPLYNEYFRPLGIRHQLSAFVHRRGTRLIAVSINRGERAFSSADLEVLRLFNAHLCDALRRTIIFSTLRTALKDPDQKAQGASGHLLILNRRTSAIEHAAEACLHLLNDAFSCRSSLGDPAPSQLCTWLKANLKLQATGRHSEHSPIPFSLKLNAGSLRIQVLSLQPDMVVLHVHADATTRPTSTPLTAREQEVLNWIAEGKRNHEIAHILGISSRTVGKHVEHVLAKVGVENRTAAARLTISPNGPRSSA